MRGYTEMPSCMIQYAKVPDGKPCSLVTAAKSNWESSFACLNCYCTQPFKWLDGSHHNCARIL